MHTSLSCTGMCFHQISFQLADDPADVTSTLKLRAVAFRALGKAWPQCASDLQG